MVLGEILKQERTKECVKPYGGSGEVRLADDTDVDGTGNGTASKPIQMTDKYSSSEEGVAYTETLAEKMAQEKYEEWEQGASSDDDLTPSLRDEIIFEQTSFHQTSSQEIMDHGEGSTDSSDKAEKLPDWPHHINHATSACKGSIFCPSNTDQRYQKYLIEPDGEMFPHARNAVEMKTGKSVILHFFPNSQLLQRTRDILEVLSDARHVYRPLEPEALRFEGYPPALAFSKESRTLKQWLTDDKHYRSDRNAALYQLFRMVQEMHDADTVVADLNPQIIVLCSEDQSWKLASLHSAASVKEGLPFDCCGCYAAPEVIRSQDDGDLSRIRKPADMWSLGILTFELFLGKKHFDCKGDAERLQEYIQENLPTLTKDEDEREALDELLQNLLCLEPNERLTVEQALKSRFFKMYIPDSRRFPSRKRTTSTDTSSTVSTPRPAVSLKIQLEVALKRFRRSDASARSLRTKPTYTISDKGLKEDGPAYIIRKSEKTLLEIGLKYNIPLDVEKLVDVKVSTPSGDTIDVRVDTVECGGRYNFKSIGILDPARFKTGPLSKRSRCFGQIDQRYAQLHVDFTIVRKGNQEPLQHGGSFFVKVVGRKSRLLFNRVDNRIRKSVQALPPWMHSVGKGVATLTQCIPF